MQKGDIYRDTVKDREVIIVKPNLSAEEVWVEFWFMTPQDYGGYRQKIDNLELIITAKDFNINSTKQTIKSCKEQIEKGDKSKFLKWKLEQHENELQKLLA